MHTDRPSSAVLLIDFQERLASAMPANELAEAQKQAGILLAGAQKLGVPMVASEQYPAGLGHTVGELAQHLPAGAVVEKIEFACTDSAAVSARLTALGKRHWVLAGMETHICVLYTALGLRQHGYEVTVAADAVCSRRASHRELALATLRAAGCRVVPVESVLFGWLGKAGSPEFKEISRLVR
jgi:nicotinamidase-related amidase